MHCWVLEHRHSGSDFQTLTSCTKMFWNSWVKSSHPARIMRDVVSVQAANAAKDIELFFFAISFLSTCCCRYVPATIVVNAPVAKLQKALQIDCNAAAADALNHVSASNLCSPIFITFLHNLIQMAFSTFCLLICGTKFVPVKKLAYGKNIIGNSHIVFCMSGDIL